MSLGNELITLEKANLLYKDLRERSAPVICNNTNGNPVVFSDGADGLPIKSLKVNLFPNQSGSGDASPTNVRPFVLWDGLKVLNGGKNLIPTSTAEFTRAKKYYFDKALPAGTYTLSALVTSTDTDDTRCLARFWMDEEPVGSDMYFTRDSRQSKTVTIGQSFNAIFLYASNGYIAAEGDTASFADMQLEIGSSASAYEPYKSVVETSISFPSSICCGSFDLLSGVLTITHILWTKNTANMNNDPEYPGWTNAGIREIIGIEKGGAITGAVSVGSMYAVNTRNANDIVYLPKSWYDGMTQDQWKALAIDVQIAMELETPMHISNLTHDQLKTLLGDNTILSDANSDIEVEYRADTELFLKQNMIKDVQVDGSSILQNGVANVPIATDSKLGVGKFSGTDYGIGITAAGIVYGVPPTEAQMKAGTNAYKPITASRQHISAFYGLSKAAGADMAQSSNPVGTYTSAAKHAIQNMIGLSGILGDYESTGTASKAYAIGDTFIFEGVRYRATSAIALNDAIAPGTNCEPDPLNARYLKISQIGGDGSYYGLNVNGANQLAIVPATDAQMKAGTGVFKPIVSSKADIATFYALAKAAGDNTQSSSSNPVGTYTAEAKAAILAMLGAVAKTDYATANTAGLVKPGSGIALEANTGKIYMDNASDAQIKSGAATNIAIPPFRQHTAAFYGLAKAAGADMASSSNAVGTYTDAAKTAIQTMLGVPSTSDLPVFATKAETEEIITEWSGDIIPSAQGVSF